MATNVRLKKSPLHQRLEKGETPLVTVNIAGRVFTDDRIIGVKISYGKNGASLATAVPTATIEIGGKLANFYNANIIISVSLDGVSTRFVGRVGSQEYTERNSFYSTTRITAISHSIRLFRDKTTFNAYNTINTLAHAVTFMFNRASVNRVPGGSGQVSSRMWAKDYFKGPALYSSSDVLSLFEKVGVATLHRRDGSVAYYHPLDRIDGMKKALETQYPVQRLNVLSGVTHENNVSYIDARPRLIYYTLGSDQPKIADLFSKFLPGIEIPATTDDTEIKDFVYSTDAWQHTALINLMQKASQKLNTPSISVDMLSLKNGNAYDRALFKQLANLEEGEFIIFSGDWPGSMQGAKVVQGIDETFTAKGWQINFSLANPDAVLGWIESDKPMPKPLELTWGQKTGTWARQEKNWG